MKKKIKIEDEDYKELLELMGVGIMLQKAGEAITKRAENILSSLAAYGVEVPEKRIEKRLKESKKSLKWIDFD